MTIIKPLFVAKRLKIIVLLNALLNICALVILLYLLNNKSSNYEIAYEITIWRMALTIFIWLGLNLFFGMLYYLIRWRDTNSKALQVLIRIHLGLAVGLVCVGLILFKITPFIILEFMGMVMAFFMPFIMLVVILKHPKNYITAIFE